MRSLIALCAAAVAAALALTTGSLVWKVAVPAGCGLSLLLRRGLSRDNIRFLPLLLALAAALVGDVFLSCRAGRMSWFIAGIFAYLGSHLGYQAYALTRGRLHLPTLLVASAGFLAYYFVQLAPRLPDWRLRSAVLAYVAVSCVSLAAAAGLRQPLLPKALFVSGISLLVFSDTLISLNEFLRERAWNGWILPTYYLALLAVTTSALVDTPANRLPSAPSPSR